MPKHSTEQKAQPQKRIYISQGDFPRESLKNALRIANALRDEFAGKSAPPHDIAVALDLSPTSGTWRSLCGTSIAYGLTEGGYNAQEIKLTELGKRVVMPVEEGDDRIAKIESILRPKLSKQFLDKYDRNKFPSDTIAQNTLVSFGLPQDRAENAVEILKENGEFTQTIKNIKTGLFVALDSIPVNCDKNEVNPSIEPDISSSSLKTEYEEEVTNSLPENSSGQASQNFPKQLPNSNKVFISHGKNREITNQLKELLIFGKFQPIISVEKEVTSIPVPEKVFEDMRDCFAGVIHISNEGFYLDQEGNEHIKINENVLIEIGAAIALYEKNFILLVEKGVKLPSNLQGLYRCEYEGQKLDYEATMKLLKTFNGFKQS